MDISEKLRELRTERGLTQQSLAEILNVKQNTYSQYETGQRQIPIGLLIVLANFYDVSTDYILGLTEIEYPYPKQ